MKSKHRHELKTNELADWIIHLPEWTKSHAKTIGIVAAVVIITLTVAWWYNYNTNVLSVQKKHRFTRLLTQVAMSQARAAESSMQGLDISHVLTQPADDLASFAQQSHDDNMAALAYIKRGEAIRAELHYRFNLTDKTVITTRIEQAQQSYNQALTRAGTNASLKAIAMFGLGLCAEEVGDFNEAKNQYEAIISDPLLEGTIAVESAKHRLQTLHAYQDSIVFKPGEEPTDMTIGDSNLVPAITLDQGIPIDKAPPILPVQGPVEQPDIAETDSNTPND